MERCRVGLRLHPGWHRALARGATLLEEPSVHSSRAGKYWSAAPQPRGRGTIVCTGLSSESGISEPPEGARKKSVKGWQENPTRASKSYPVNYSKLICGSRLPPSHHTLGEREAFRCRLSRHENSTANPEFIVSGVLRPSVARSTALEPLPFMAGFQLIGSRRVSLSPVLRLRGVRSTQPFRTKQRVRRL